MKTIEKQKTMKKTISRMARRQRKVTFASVRPTTGWRLTLEGVNEDGHFLRVYTRYGEEVVKDLTTGRINAMNKYKIKTK